VYQATQVIISTHAKPPIVVDQTHANPPNASRKVTPNHPIVGPAACGSKQLASNEWRGWNGSDGAGA